MPGHNYLPRNRSGVAGKTEDERRRAKKRSGTFKPRSDTCGSPGCDEPRAEDSYLCPVHHRMVLPVKLALEAEEDPYGTRGSRPANAPQCTKPGCRNPRKPGHGLCADCAEEAFWESGEEDEG